MPHVAEESVGRVTMYASMAPFRYCEVVLEAEAICSSSMWVKYCGAVIGSIVMVVSRCSDEV